MLSVMIRQNERLTGLIQPVVEGLGFELWGLEYLPQGKPAILRVYIDKADGIDIDDCQTVSQQLVGVLDVEDPIPGAYNLEVSSPGIDRVLFTLEQCERFVGHEVSVRLSRKHEGRRRFTGMIKAVTDAELMLEEQDQAVTLPIDLIDLVRLTTDNSLDINKRRN